MDWQNVLKETIKMALAKRCYKAHIEWDNILVIIFIVITGYPMVW
jgi:hypothetical protein